MTTRAEISPENRFKKTLMIAFLLSIFAHMGAMFGLRFVSDYMERWVAEHKVPEPIVIELTPISPQKRIVDSNKGFEVDKAVKDSYLGEKNRVVLEETVAKETGMYDRPKTPKVAESQTPAVEKSTSPSKSKPSLKALIGNLGVAIAPPMQKPMSPKETVNWAGQEDMGEKKNEYIKGLKESEVTALNTKEFVYFSYYQRIRERLDLAWRPILRDEIGRIYRTGRRLATDRDHTTRTIVVINLKGEVVKIKILEQSGTTNLDEAAVRAFNAAGPFPNPPTGLVGNSGTVEIPWDFILRT